MTSAANRQEYRATIGIECHVQLSTNTKLFSSVANDARNAKPNSLISHICLGMPGALPVLNEKAVEYAMRMAFAFHTTPQKYSYFERKHYFYPDLPKGYQITQLSHPIVVGGYVQCLAQGGMQKIRINRVQIEEDAGKSIHPEGADYSLVDLNRAGTPLLEIVSEPDIHTAQQARSYAEELYLLVRYAGVSDADMYHGNMRFDVNVSVSKTEELGIRTETKNLNSFRSIEKAVEYEINRQIEQLEKRQPVIQETRGWNDAKQKTFSQRSKEDAHDYRYFPDPDIPPVVLSDAYIKSVETSMPTMPDAWRVKLADAKLDPVLIGSLLTAEAHQVGFLGAVQQFLKTPKDAKKVADLIVNVEIPLRNQSEKALLQLSEQQRISLYQHILEMLEKNLLSSTAAKELIRAVLNESNFPKDIVNFATVNNLIQVSDEQEIIKLVAEVVSENSTAADDVRNGEMKAIGFLVGQVMKKSQGKANPSIVQDEIRRQLVGGK
jgi:aspartyl-tRNA(Asn)/glutamyl-tRNA(Gln) amidotransferase subunit B